MSDKEMLVARCKNDVAVAESELKEARREFEAGSRKAKAEYDKALVNLHFKVERAMLKVAKENDYLKNAETKLNEPFKNNDD